MRTVRNLLLILMVPCILTACAKKEPDPYQQSLIDASNDQIKLVEAQRSAVLREVEIHRQKFNVEVAVFLGSISPDLVDCSDIIGALTASYVDSWGITSRKPADGRESYLNTWIPSKKCKFAGALVGSVATAASCMTVHLTSRRYVSQTDEYGRETSSMLPTDQVRDIYLPVCIAGNDRRTYSIQK